MSAHNYGQWVTSAQIEDLLSRATAAGDLEMIRICHEALEGDQSALRECARALDDAQAKD